MKSKLFASHSKMSGLARRGSWPVSFGIIRSSLLDLISISFEALLISPWRIRRKKFLFIQALFKKKFFLFVLLLLNLGFTANSLGETEFMNSIPFSLGPLDLMTDINVTNANVF